MSAAARLYKGRPKGTRVSGAITVLLCHGESCPKAIKLSELGLNENASVAGLHGCPVNRAHTIMGDTKGHSALRTGSCIPSSSGSCGFRPRTAQESGGCWPEPVPLTPEQHLSEEDAWVSRPWVVANEPTLLPRQLVWRRRRAEVSPAPRSRRTLSFWGSVALGKPPRLKPFLLWVAGQESRSCP